VVTWKICNPGLDRLSATHFVTFATPIWVATHTLGTTDLDHHSCSKKEINPSKFSRCTQFEEFQIHNKTCESDKSGKHGAELANCPSYPAIHANHFKQRSDTSDTARNLTHPMNSFFCFFQVRFMWSMYLFV